MRVIIRETKRAFGRTRIPNAKYVLNPYIGCLHGCKYCYVQSLAKRFGWRYGEWGSWVIVRKNIYRLVKRKSLNGWILVSSLGDAYQPIERKFKLTRCVFDAIDHNNRLRILTKSDLIVRDLDVLGKFKSVEIGLTVNSFDERLRRKLEPEAVSMERRLNALRTAKDKGFRTFGFVSPVIPYLTDVEAVLSELKGLVDYMILEVLNPCVEDFVKWLKESYPESWNVLRDRWKFESFIRDLKDSVKGLASVYYHPQQL
ncbi:radical SAM protein [Archaeoglobus sp.]